MPGGRGVALDEAQLLEEERLLPGPCHQHLPLKNGAPPQAPVEAAHYQPGREGGRLGSCRAGGGGGGGLPNACLGLKALDGANRNALRNI